MTSSRIFGTCFLILIMGISFGAINPTAADALTAEIGKYHIRIQGVNYRRKKADDAYLGSIGKKRDIAHSYFERLMDVPANFRVKTGKWVKLTGSQERNWNVSVSGKKSSLSGKGSASGKGNMKYSYRLYSVTFTNKTRVKNKLNGVSRLISDIRDFKGDMSSARIVSMVWILIQGTEDQFSSWEASGDVSGTSKKGGSISLSGSGGKSKTVSFNFQRGSIMAYSFDRFKYDSRKDMKI